MTAFEFDGALPDARGQSNCYRSIDVCHPDDWEFLEQRDNMGAPDSFFLDFQKSLVACNEKGHPIPLRADWESRVEHHLEQSGDCISSRTRLCSILDQSWWLASVHANALPMIRQFVPFAAALVLARLDWMSKDERHMLFSSFRLSSFMAAACRSRGKKACGDILIATFCPALVPLLKASLFCPMNVTAKDLMAKLPTGILCDHQLAWSTIAFESGRRYAMDYSANHPNSRMLLEAISAMAHTSSPADDNLQLLKQLLLFEDCPGAVAARICAVSKDPPHMGMVYRLNVNHGGLDGTAVEWESPENWQLFVPCTSEEQWPESKPEDRDDISYPAFYEAADSGDAAAALVHLQTRIQDDGEPPNKDDPAEFFEGKDNGLNEGFNYLGLAAQLSHPEMIRLLLRFGYSNMPSAAGTAPLNVAALNTSKAPQERVRSCVQILLDHGADPNYAEPGDGSTALHNAVHNNQCGVVEELLTHPRSSLAAREHIHRLCGHDRAVGITPFCRALTRGEIGMIKLFLAHNVRLPLGPPPPGSFEEIFEDPQIFEDPVLRRACSESYLDLYCSIAMSVHEVTKEDCEHAPGDVLRCVLLVTATHEAHRPLQALQNIVSKVAAIGKSLPGFIDEIAGPGRILPWTKVWIHGLKADQHLNGQAAVVTRFTKGRYAVRLGNGAQVSCVAGNLETEQMKRGRLAEQQQRELRMREKALRQEKEETLKTADIKPAVMAVLGRKEIAATNFAATDIAVCEGGLQTEVGICHAPLCSKNSRTVRGTDSYFLLCCSENCTGPIDAAVVHFGCFNSLLDDAKELSGGGSLPSHILQSLPIWSTGPWDVLKHHASTPWPCNLLCTPGCSGYLSSVRSAKQVNGKTREAPYMTQLKPAQVQACQPARAAHPQHRARAKTTEDAVRGSEADAKAAQLLRIKEQKIADKHARAQQARSAAVLIVDGATQQLSGRRAGKKNFKKHQNKRESRILANAAKKCDLTASLCVFCQDNLCVFGPTSRIAVTKCRHLFHLHCWERSKQHQFYNEDKCPVCSSYGLCGSIVIASVADFQAKGQEHVGCWTCSVCTITDNTLVMYEDASCNTTCAVCGNNRQRQRDCQHPGGPRALRVQASEWKPASMSPAALRATALPVSLPGSAIPYDLECQICLDEQNNEPSNPSVLVCSSHHAFHTKCIRQWVEKSATCPSCQQKIGADALEFAFLN
jgi:hypothetical protein